MNGSMCGTDCFLQVGRHVRHLSSRRFSTKQPDKIIPVTGFFRGPTIDEIRRGHINPHRVNFMSFLGHLSSLSALLSHAVSLRWIEENPCFRLTKLKENPGRDRVLTDDEIARLLAACRRSKSSYLYCFVLISLTTGARQGEVLDLEWRHVDLENKVAHLKETKNGHPRSICLSDAVVAELTRLHQKRNPAKPLVFASKTALGKVDLKKAWLAFQRFNHQRRKCY